MEINLNERQNERQTFEKHIKKYNMFHKYINAFCTGMFFEQKKYQNMDKMEYNLNERQNER